MTSSHNGADEGEALAIAISALSYFATEPKILERFFALTGLEAHSIKEAAATPGFVTGVLDFVLSDEALLLEVAQMQEIPPEAIMAARERLDRPVAEDDWPPRTADDWA